MQWTEHLTDDLVDIILDNDKYKEKLLLTNVKNVKNGQYYDKVIEEVMERCSKRGEEFPLNDAQTQQKFKRCINICRYAVMKVNTSSDFKRFQEDKELVSCFGKFLPIISSINNCQPQQAIEPGRKAPETNGKEPLPDKSQDGDTCKEETSQGSSSRFSAKASNAKTKYVPIPAYRKRF